MLYPLIGCVQGGIKCLNTESIWPNYQRVLVKLKYILNSIQVEILEWVTQMELCCNLPLEYFECLMVYL